MADIIHKYRLEITGRQIVLMPEGAKVLHVGVQRFDLCLWAQHRQDRPATERHFAICGTGHELPRLETRTYIGTVVTEPFVWHVFELSEKDW